MWPNVVHKWLAAKSGRHNLQICPETRNTYYDVILHNLSRHEGLEAQNTRGSHFFKEAANFPGFDPDLYAALWSISLLSHHSNIQIWYPRPHKFLEASCAAQQWCHFWKKRWMCLDIRLGWLLHICLQGSSPILPQFSRINFQATLFRHQFCAALILSFIFKLLFEICNPQMLCLL